MYTTTTQHYDQWVCTNELNNLNNKQIITLTAQ